MGGTSPLSHVLRSCRWSLRTVASWAGWWATFSFSKRSKFASVSPLWLYSSRAQLPSNGSAGKMGYPAVWLNLHQGVYLHEFAAQGSGWCQPPQ